LIFESAVYQQGSGDNIENYHDIFSLIEAKSDLRCDPLLPKGPLSLTIAIGLFTDYLAGNYFGSGLFALQKYFAAGISDIKSYSKGAEISFYEGIYEIISMRDSIPSEQCSLLFSIKKITDFAKIAPYFLQPAILPLLYNKYFRNLFAYGLNLYLTYHQDLFDTKVLAQFGGFEETKELLTVLRERLINNNENENENENLVKLIRYMKLLYTLEKDLLHLNDATLSAEEYRETAFHILDWLPSFIGNSNEEILVNLFIQIGITLLRASRIETFPAVKMADESLALNMFFTAVDISHHSTPDVELYAHIHSLKYILNFEFHDAAREEVISAFNNRILVISDIFPFFETTHSNVSFLKQENKVIYLMRNLLHQLVKIYKHNQTHPDNIVIDHSNVTILYQAYEACLKNWYQEEHDPELESMFRLDLMDELLFERSWLFLDVEQHLDIPWMVERDNQGWFEPTDSLPFLEAESYCSINGFEINHKKGEINFCLTPWNEKNNEGYEKRFTLHAFQEMIEKNMSGASFSLDLVDPDKPYHPFNQMRFVPPQLFESELLNTMLLTDYILKFLTTNQEVQGFYPFEQRPVAAMLKHLPEYLIKIIDDFHRAPHTGAVHRFWIEAEEVDIFLPDDESEKSATTMKFGLDSIKMVVKKHRMLRDIEGNLKDSDEDEEGWPIYVLTPEQMAELEAGEKVITDNAMIFIFPETKLYYWENNATSLKHIPENYRETLIRLYKQPRDEDGRVTQNIKNQPLIYRVTKEMARQSGQPHRYSAEFIFAHEFTTHYDEFAQYLPEFGQLKELSKIVTSIRILNTYRKKNKGSIRALNYMLDDASPSLQNKRLYHGFKKQRKKIASDISTLFKELRKEFTTTILEAKREQLREIYDKIPKYIHTVVPGRVYTTHVRVDAYGPYRKQIYEATSALLNAIDTDDYNSLIDLFMQGETEWLADALVNYERNKQAKDLNKQLPKSSTNEIIQALDSNGEAVAAHIAKKESYRQLEEKRKSCHKLEAGFMALHLGERENTPDHKEECFWVPASVRHEVRKDSTTGLTRHSFFVYGGVNINARVNTVPGGNRPIGGNPVGGGSFNRKAITNSDYYQYHHIVSHTNQHTKSHPLLKLAGFNDKKSMDSTVNRIYLPKYPGIHETRSIHNGRHTDKAMENVAEKMNKIVLLGKAQNWNQAQYRNELRNMLVAERAELRAGTIDLYVDKKKPRGK
jgi:hypothetical protein